MATTFNTRYIRERGGGCLWKDKDLIKVVTGIRRCGKSTLFELYIDYLKSIGIDDNHICC